MTTRHRNYCFTINNYDESQIENLEKIDCEYIIYGKEIAPSTGTPHLQGFIKFKNAKSFNAVKKLIPKAHIEITVGTPEQNIEYCSKGGNFEERGTRPKAEPGKRNDLAKIKKSISQNKRIKYCLEKNIIKNYQGLKYAETLQKYYEKPRDWKTEVSWYYGATGTGKSFTAYEDLLKITDADNIYHSMDTGKWWDGYDGQEYVIIDDMRKDFLKFHQLLRLLDRFPYRIENKGGTRQFVARKIIITSCYHPTELYDTREDLEQLLRRIDEIKQFTEKKY